MSSPSQATPRVDLFALVHKGIRAALADALAAAGRLDGEDHEDTARLVASVRELALFCRAHLRHEETLVHPAMEARRPGSTRAGADEHRHHAADLDRLEALADGLLHLPSLRREAAARALYAALAAFTADNLVHMAREEADHNAVLWETHDDDELAALRARIVAAQTPEEARIARRWMLPFLSPAERAAVLASLRAEAPADVFEVTLAGTLSLLDERNAGKLRSALGIPRRPLDYIGVV